MKDALLFIFSIPLMIAFFFIPFGIALAGWIAGGIWAIIGIIAGIIIFIWQIRWFSRRHEKGELEEWKALLKDPDYEPSFSEVLVETAGKSKKEVHALARKRIRELQAAK